MKKIAPLLVIFCVLSGCETIGMIKTFRTFDSTPIMGVLFQGKGNKQAINEIQRPDSTVMYFGGEIECANYKLQKEGKTQDLFVSYDRAGNVSNYGYSTCQVASEHGAVK